MCPRLTTEYRALFVRCGGKVPPRPERLDGNNIVEDVVEQVSNARGTSQSTLEDSCTVPSNVVRPGLELTPLREPSTEQETPRASSSRLHRQSTLVDGFEAANKRNLNAVWARFFYEANIPFSVARSASFKEAVKRTSEFGRSYTPPSYHDLRHKLLEDAKVDVQMKLQKRTEESIRKFGATLSIDGWSSVVNRPLINGMLISSAGEEFLGSVDTSGATKDATYLADVLIKFIEQVGLENVVQVTTDNASVNLRAWELVSEKYPHIFFQGCIVHALNLLLKDWGKEAWIKTQVQRAKTILKFIKNRHKPLAIFREHETRKTLLMPGKTRFASNFMMIARLLEVKTALQQTVVASSWT